MKSAVAWSLALAAAWPAGVGSPEDAEDALTPRPLAWESLDAEAFDASWILPEHGGAQRDLLPEMRRLAELRLPPFELPGPAGGPARTLSTFGDVARVLFEVPSDQREEWLARVGEAAPAFLADWGAGLRELFLDERLRGEHWRPEDDHPRDGILTAEDWRLGARTEHPVLGAADDPPFAQAAVLLRTDLATFKEVENDYRRYHDHVGASYEHIGPLRGRYFTGSDPLGRPFSALAIRFRSDLPFPFGSYACELRILNRFAADGSARTDIYSTSRDFHFLAGRDVFLPVRDSRGSQVATLLVRHFGFDLRGVPDGPANWREALRSTLGNLKLRAEELFARRGGRFRASPDAHTRFPVRGARP